MQNLPSILVSYTPKNFGKEYFKIKGSAQYPMFCSVALGIKPVMDDWVAIDDMPLYESVCRGYGLSVVPNIVFAPYTAKNKQFTGGKNVTTTLFRGERFTGDNREGTVHVLISKSKETALEAKKFSWYSTVINGRSTNKPFVDHLRYGAFLGYPPCCIDFFRARNNWHIYSYPVESLKNTPKINGTPKLSYYCNNFLMDFNYSFIHHLPCSYSCPSTITLAKKLETALMGVEPHFVESAKEMLQKPLLIFGERHFIIFEGSMTQTNSKATIEYSNAQYLHNPARSEENIDFFNEILKNSHITVDETGIVIGGSSSPINKQQQWFALRFEDG